MLVEQVNQLNTDWKDFLLKYSSDLDKISKEIQNEKDIYEPNLCIFPPTDLIFNAFNKFNKDLLKVVFIGQDCYHGKGQANGLCFSVPETIAIPPSLKNIYKEIEDDIPDYNKDNHLNGDLTYLAEQGILLLNTSLTVRQAKAGSHAKIWQKFTQLLLENLTEETKNIIFLLWGNHAKKYKQFIKNEHIFYEATHPSPLGANRCGWFKSKHFSKTNKILEKLNKNQIDW